jgi:hypothetical protein
MSESEPDNPADDIVSARGELILYPTEDGRSRVECRFEHGTLWLSQGAMVELYQTSKPNVSMHLKAIFAEGELDENAVVKHFLTTALDGKNYQVGHYHLDAVLAVGYRVRSPRGTQFRRWATDRLREYLVKGFTMDDERLKNPPGPSVPGRLPGLQRAARPARPRQVEARGRRGSCRARVRPLRRPEARRPRAGCRGRRAQAARGGCPTIAEEELSTMLRPYLHCPSRQNWNPCDG